MANIFPPHANRRFYGIIALGMLVLALILGGVYYLNFYVKEHTPVQPVRFSHKLHCRGPEDGVHVLPRRRVAFPAGRHS